MSKPDDKEEMVQDCATCHGTGVYFSVLSHYAPHAKCGKCNGTGVIKVRI